MEYCCEEFEGEVIECHLGTGIRWHTHTKKWVASKNGVTTSTYNYCPFCGKKLKAQGEDDD